jgi:4-amino-4-deoxy-L-arabinose transferase-like glycosyltransferase
MSAFFGALSIYAFYLLAREMFSRTIALTSSMLMAVTPLFWLNSVKAMSDMVGLFFVLASMLFVYRHIKYKKPDDLYLGAVLAGISLGVRIHYLFLLLPVLVYGAAYRKGHMNVKVKGFAMMALAVLACFLPMILVTGIPEYFSALQDQVLYRVDRPDISVIGAGQDADYVSQRAVGFPYFFLLGGYGVNLVSLGILSIPLLALMAGLAALFLKRVRPGDRRFLFFAPGLTIYILVVFAMLPPFSPRYLLILVPLLSLAFARAAWGFGKPTRHVLIGVLAFLMLFHSVLFALQIRTIPAAPVQMIHYVNQRYGPETFMVIGGFSEKYLAYYGTGMSELPAGATGCETIGEILEDGKSVLTLSPGECPGLEFRQVATFWRDPRVHIKRSKTTLYEFVPEGAQ